MQCPNCGKEALNVNGRYVCLDCGIEIATNGAAINYQEPQSSSQQPVGQSSVTNSIDQSVNNQNAFTAFGGSVISKTNQDEESAQSETPKQEQDSVKDYYLDNLSKLTDENSSSDTETLSSLSGGTGSVVPDFPEVDQAEGPTQPLVSETITHDPSLNWPEEGSFNNNPPGISTVYSQSAPTMNSQDTSQNSFSDLEDNALDSHQEILNHTTSKEVLNSDHKSSSGQGIVGGGYSAAQVGKNSESHFEANETSSEPTIAQPIGASADFVPQNQIRQDNIPGETENYFRPSSFNINSSNQNLPEVNLANEAVVSSPNLETSSVSTEESNLPPNSEPFNEPLENQSDLSGFSPPVLPKEEGVLARDPLEISQPAVSPKGAASQGYSLPGVNNIPSAESVFGPMIDDSSTDHQNFVVKNKASGKKIILIAIISILGALISAGIVYGFLSLLNKKNELDQFQSNTEKVLSISSDVGSKMDALESLSVKFDQTIDFANFKIKESSGDQQKINGLKNFLAAPYVFKGSWRSDKEGDVALEGEINTKIEKRIYIKQENNTYVFSQETKNWIKVGGYQVAIVPPLYPVDSKGSLFYAMRTSDIKDGGKISEGGQSYQRYLIVPQKEVIKDLIVAANPTLFTDIKIESADLSRFVIEAYIDEESRIAKVSAKGEIALDTNYASGTIKVISEGLYNFDNVDVAKP